MYTGRLSAAAAGSAPVLRVRALQAARAGRAARARALILRSVGLLERSPNRLWLLPAYRDAADLVPGRREEFLGRAAALRRDLGLLPSPGSPR